MHRDLMFNVESKNRCYKGKISDEQKEEIEVLMVQGEEYSEPVQTDASCCQYRVDVKGEPSFIFSQYEITNPETGETRIRTDRIDMKSYESKDISSACRSFGLEASLVPPHILAEMMFELEM